MLSLSPPLVPGYYYCRSGEEIAASYFEHTLIEPLLRSLGLGLINRLSRVAFDIDPAGQSMEARRKGMGSFRSSWLAVLWAELRGGCDGVANWTWTWAC
jgi:hypothetical protein